MWAGEGLTVEVSRAETDLEMVDGALSIHISDTQFITSQFKLLEIGISSDGS